MAVRKYSLEDAKVLNYGGIYEETPSKSGHKRVASTQHAWKRAIFHSESENDQFDTEKRGLKPVEDNVGFARKLYKTPKHWEEIASRWSLSPNKKTEAIFMIH